MSEQTPEPDQCFVCQKQRGVVSVAGGVIFENDLIYISHAQIWGKETDHYLGHLFVEPKRHVAELGDLTAAEAREIGLYVSCTSKALVETLGVEHVYAFVIGDGAAHVHVHVIGRYPGAPCEYWGAKVDEWPGASRGGEVEIARVSEKVRKYLSVNF